MKSFPHPSNKLPKAVFMDLDNTLYPYQPANEAGMIAIYSKLHMMYSLEKKDMEGAFLQARKEIKEQLGNVASSHSRLLYFQRMLENLGLNTQAYLSLDLEQSYWRAYLRHSQLFDGVKTFLSELRLNNIKSVIITDLTAQIQFRKLIHFNIDELIDYVVSSEEAGTDKPNKEIFLLALKKVGCKPEDVWMIGDSIEKDINGAMSLGIKSIYKIDSKCSEKIPMSFSNFNELLLF